jgi:hypothetical protein
MTAREQFELDHFGISPGKIGQRHHAAKPYPPSAWKKSLKYWAALWLGVAVGAAAAGVLVVLLELVS